MLHCAASNGRLELVEFLLKNVFVENANCRNDLGETPLHLAAKGKFGLDEKLCLKTSCSYIKDEEATFLEKLIVRLFSKYEQEPKML